MKQATWAAFTILVKIVARPFTATCAATCHHMTTAASAVRQSAAAPTLRTDWPTSHPRRRSLAISDCMHTDYLDQASQFVTVTDNIAYDVKCAGFLQVRCEYICSSSAAVGSN